MHRRHFGPGPGAPVSNRELQAQMAARADFKPAIFVAKRTRLKKILASGRLLVMFSEKTISNFP